MREQNNVSMLQSWLIPGHATFPGADSERTFVPTISLIIPVLNEAKNLPFILRRIPQWIDEVVLIDGHSTDGTLEVARQLWRNSHIITHERRRTRLELQSSELSEKCRGETTLRLVTQSGRGKGGALRDGFAVATGDIIVMLDADGSNDPAEIPAFLGALMSGADFAKGTRFVQGGGTSDMPLYRKLGNWGFVLLARLLFATNYTDLCYGYNAFWSRVVPLLDLDADGFEIETMMNLRAAHRGLRITEVASFEYERIHGTSNLRTIPDGWRVVKTILSETFRYYGGKLKFSTDRQPVTVKPQRTIKLENDPIS